MRELEVEIMNLRDLHFLPTVDRTEPRGMRGHQVSSRNIYFDQVRAVMAIRTRLLRMTRHAGRCRETRCKLMLMNKVTAVVRHRPQGGEIEVALLACIGSLYIIVTRVAGRHRRDLGRDSNFGLINTGVALLAFNLLILGMKLVGKNKVTLWQLRCFVGIRFLARVAVGALGVQLVLVAALTVFVLGEERVSRKLARHGGNVTVGAGYSRLPHVEAMRELDRVGLTRWPIGSAG